MPPRPILLVHGAWHGAWCWAALQAELDRRGVASWAVDLPGHGLSTEPLGDLVTTLPAGQEYPGRTAGPSFELFYESDYVLPHREAAWALLAERMDEAAGLCLQIQDDHDRAVAERLAPVLGALREMSRTLAAELPGAPATALLCLEADPAGCHRRVVAELLAERVPGLVVEDL